MGKKEKEVSRRESRRVRGHKGKKERERESGGRRLQAANVRNFN